MTKIKLGQKVRDTISGNEGTVVAVTTWLNGCVRMCIQPEGTKDGAPFETFVIDEEQLEIVRMAPDRKTKPTGGSRKDPGRSPDPEGLS